MKWNVLKTRKSKLGLLTVAVLLIVSLSIGGTLAYLSKSYDEANNEFQLVAAYCEIEETFNGTSKSGIKVSIPESNEGTTCMDAYVRMSLVCNWQDADGNVVAKFDELPDLSQLTLGEGWARGSDGYYYYTDILEAGSETTALFTEAITRTSTEGYTLNVTVLAEAIQANAGVWTVASVNSDGALTIQ